MLLRLILACRIGTGGLRLTAAWATASGLADVSNVAPLSRLRSCEAWLQSLIGRLLSAWAGAPATGRLIGDVDATSVAKAARAERIRNGLWRVHGAFDLPAERFGHFEHTDERGGERLDRVPVIEGEIRIGDAAYLLPLRLVATRLPPEQAEAARQRVRQAAQKKGYTLSAAALVGCEWVMVVTSLSVAEFSSRAIIYLYSLRERV